MNVIKLAAIAAIFRSVFLRLRKVEHFLHFQGQRRSLCAWKKSSLCLTLFSVQDITVE